MMKYSIEYYRELALKRKGLCLSDKYLGPQEPLLWQCEFGHQWMMDLEHIKRGQWCPECRKQKRETVK